MFRTSLLLGFALIATGCNRHDAEVLSRIGKRVATHARNGVGEVGSKVDLSWAGARKEPSLQEKAQDRLRYENTLTEFHLEVIGKEKEIELKGVVATPSQKQRAIELTETIAGVERVIDSIQVREGEEQAK